MEREKPQAVFFNGFTLDLARGCLLRGDLEVKLRPKSFELLRYLIENHGRLISKEELIRSVWVDAAVTDNSLSQCLIELRRALGDDSQTIIRNVPRRGYIFDIPVTGESGERRLFGTLTRNDQLRGRKSVKHVGKGPDSKVESLFPYEPAQTEDSRCIKIQW